jgi:hypothetical protein
VHACLRVTSDYHKFSPCHNLQTVTINDTNTVIVRTFYMDTDKRGNNLDSCIREIPGSNLYGIDVQLAARGELPRM